MANVRLRVVFTRASFTVLIGTAVAASVLGRLQRILRQSNSLKRAVLSRIVSVERSYLVAKCACQVIAVEVLKVLLILITLVVRVQSPAVIGMGEDTLVINGNLFPACQVGWHVREAVFI